MSMSITVEQARMNGPRDCLQISGTFDSEIQDRRLKTSSGRNIKPLVE